jgi:hypothetical protein
MKQHFKLIHDAGFQTARINLHALQLYKKGGKSWFRKRIDQAKRKLYNI